MLDMRRWVSEVESRLEVLEGQRQTFKKHVDRVRSEMQAREENVKRALASVETVRQAAETSRKRIDALVTSHKARLQNIDRQLDNIRKTVEDLENEAANRVVREAKHRTRIEDLEGSLGAIGEVARLAGRVETLEDSVAEMAENLGDVEWLSQADGGCFSLPIPDPEGAVPIGTAARLPESIEVIFDEEEEIRLDFGGGEKGEGEDEETAGDGVLLLEVDDSDLIEIDLSVFDEDIPHEDEPEREVISITDPVSLWYPVLDEQVPDRADLGVEVDGVEEETPESVRSLPFRAKAEEFAVRLRQWNRWASTYLEVDGDVADVARVTARPNEAWAYPYQEGVEGAERTAEGCGVRIEVTARWTDKVVFSIRPKEPRG